MNRLVVHGDSILLNLSQLQESTVYERRHRLGAVLLLLRIVQGRLFEMHRDILLFESFQDNRIGIELHRAVDNFVLALPSWYSAFLEVVSCQRKPVSTCYATCP